jgi:hypothetical protein
VTIFGVTIPCYAALSSLILNLTASAILSAIFNALSQTRADATRAEDYL